MENDCPRRRWANIVLGRKRKVLRKNGQKNLRKTRQGHLNNNSKKPQSSVWYYLMVHKSEISFKNRKNCTYLYDLDHETTTTTITTGYLKKKSGWLANPGGGNRNRSKKFLKKSLMPAFFVSPNLQGLQCCKSSSMKSVRAAIMIVSFPRHHTAKHL